VRGIDGQRRNKQFLGRHRGVPARHHQPEVIQRVKVGRIGGVRPAVHGFGLGEPPDLVEMSQSVAHVVGDGDKVGAGERCSTRG